MYSHLELRAKPCCGSLPVAWSLGGGPKHLGYQSACTVLAYSEEGPGVVRTGKTTGIPPLTGLLPSSFAAELTHRFSLPLPFQLTTVAPYRRTSTLSPVGRVAIIRSRSLWTEG